MLDQAKREVEQKQRPKREVEQKQRQAAETNAANASVPKPDDAGDRIEMASFGRRTIEIYDGGYVRVLSLLDWNAPFEKLRSIKYSHQVQDKSAGGRALASIATWGVSRLASNEKRVLFLTIATDAKVHTLKTTGDMTRLADQAGKKLEAAGQAIIGAQAAAPVVAHATAHDAPPAAPDPMEQLRKLAELRDAGILTEEEFTAKKADILGRM